jgi:AcrR family transcriptional regulator
MVELLREREVAAVTVAHIVERSGVSRRTFYELFEDREACFLATFDHAVARMAERVRPAYLEAGDEWRRRIRAALAAALGFIDEQPAVGALCVVDALAGGPRALERRAEVLEVLVGIVDQGRLEGKGTHPRRLVAEGVVGAVLAVLHGRLLAENPGSLTKLLNQLTAMVVLPYLGPDAASAELVRRAPRARRVTPTKTVDPLRALDMRMTYRTVRVLLAVAEQPDASSRRVADASGVSDQGQMSKLLWRLEHLGLIANTAPRPGRGEPNAWALTSRGHEVEQTIRAQTRS